MKIGAATTWLYGGAAVLATIAVVWFLARPRETARAIASTAAGAVTGAAAGAVEGVGQAVGVPITDEAKCQACIAARDWLRASLYCPAGTFIGAAFGRSSSSSSAPTGSTTPGARVSMPGAAPGMGAAPDFDSAPGGDDFYLIGAGA